MHLTLQKKGQKVSSVYYHYKFPRIVVGLVAFKMYYTNPFSNHILLIKYFIEDMWHTFLSKIIVICPKRLNWIMKGVDSQEIGSNHNSDFLVHEYGFLNTRNAIFSTILDHDTFELGLILISGPLVAMLYV